MGKQEISRSLEPDMSRAAPMPFTDTVVMCSKCCRKLGEEGKALRRRVKAAIADAYGDAVHVEKEDCFSLCPKGGQVIEASAKGQSPRLLILDPNAEVERAVAYLLG